MLPRLVLLGSFVCLTACGTMYNFKDIPGLDRIFHRDSSAAVGPLKTQDGDIISGTETDDVVSPQNSPSIEPVDEHANVMQVKPSLRPKATVVPSPIPAQLPTQSVTKKSEKVVPPKQDYGISGKVTLVAKAGNISPKGVIVRLVHQGGISLQESASDRVHDLDMETKIYKPGQMIIRKGDTVNFVNKDRIQHNVFSSTGENAFDLGTFGGGLQRGVRLNKEGVVKIYCNIHPKMAAFVAVDDTGISKVIQSDNGLFSFSGLPPGDYALTLWSVRGEQVHSITLGDTTNESLDLVFDTSNYVAPKRTDKFGKSYRKKAIQEEYY